MTTAKPARQVEDEPIDYDSLEYDPFDPDPMPDAMLQYPVLKGLLAVLSSRAEAKNPGQPVFDGSNTIVCYDRTNLNVRVAPDYYFAVGVDPATVIPRGIYRTWVQGKPPDFVLEVASPSTARHDESRKRDIYASMGVPEYWRYDATDRNDPEHRPLYAVPLVGEILVNGVYQPLPIAPGAEGCIMGYSPALGVSLAVKDNHLVVYDHELEDFVAEFAEQERAKNLAQAEAQAEREIRVAAENELREQASTIRRLEGELRRLREGG